MTDAVPPALGGPPGRGALPARVFRALYTQSGLREAGGTFVVTPKGTPCFTAPTLGEIARQISHHEHPGPPAARG